MASKERIIETATKLFLKNGVKSITIDRIVSELHISKRAIYKTFKDKTTLLRACLDVYHEKVRAENEQIISTSDNVIEAMAYLHQRIVRRSYEVNPNFFSDIIHYYPGLLNESYNSNGNFAHEQLVRLAKWGLEEDIFLPDMDIEVTVKTVLAMLKLLKDNKQFPVTEFSKQRLTFGIMVPYLRGLCTPKGYEILQVQEELFRISI